MGGSSGEVVRAANDRKPLSQSPHRLFILTTMSDLLGRAWLFLQTLLSPTGYGVRFLPNHHAYQPVPETDEVAGSSPSRAVLTWKKRSQLLDFDLGLLANSSAISNFQSLVKDSLGEVKPILCLLSGACIAWAEREELGLPLSCSLIA